MDELTAAQYHLVDQPLRGLGFNTYFCRAIAAGQAPGRIIVDDLADPTAYYFRHSCGMSLLVGDHGNQRFAEELIDLLSQRTQDEWLQIDPPVWRPVLSELLDSPRVMHYRRQDFSFDAARYERLGFDSSRYDIVAMTPDMYAGIEGAVVPTDFWSSAELFAATGQGFGAVESGQIVATAFSAFVLDGALEISIETRPDRRGQGYATAVCVALIDYCLAHGLEPVWSCRFENTASVQLAQKLGFVPTVQLPYFQIQAVPPS